MPVRPSSALATKTIQFSPSSLALQSFAEELQRYAPSKLLNHSRSGIEILVLDVLPLGLDTVFVALEGDLSKRLENGEGTFHTEHPRTNGHAKVKPTSAEQRLQAAIREALSSLAVVHTGDLFALPLAPHPITHVFPSPAQVTLCEPVSQGILLPSTKLIVTRTKNHARANKKVQHTSLKRALQGVAEADEDTSNEQFFSAAEDRYKTDAPTEPDDTETETELEDLEVEAEDNLSDDSMDDMISLQAPMLSATSASGISTMQPGTPHALNLGRRTGINSPGSVFSSYTATTARAGGQRGRLFKAQCLLKPLPDQLLRPSPPVDDDEGSRIYVDVNSLTKIGCFSGDWVRVESASEPPANGLGGLWTLGSFGQPQDDEDFHWRAAKVYSLPEGYSQRPMTRIQSSRQPEARRMSFFDSQVSKPASPTVYLSPVLLANLESPPYLRLSALRRNQQFGKPTLPKITSATKPPFAREVTFLRVATPLSSERALQAASIAGLKSHFTRKTRFIKSGDLIAVPIDETLGRTLSTTREDFLVDEGVSNAEESTASGVVWFKVGHVATSKIDVNEDEEEDIWGGIAFIDAQSTQLVQAGTQKGKIPATTENTWEYYFNIRRTPKGNGEWLSSALPELPSQHISGLRRRLRELMAAATSPRAVHLKLPPVAILLVSTQRSIGKATVASTASKDIGLHAFAIDAYDILTEGGQGGDVKTESFLKARAERAMTCGAENCALLIRHLEALTADRMNSALKEVLADTRVLIATTTEVDKIPDGVRGLFTHEIEMTAPDEGEREGILRSIIDDQGVALAHDVDLSSVAIKTAALVAGDLVDVVDRALVAKRVRLEALAAAAENIDSQITIRDVLVSGGPSSRCLVKADFDFAVEAARKNFADSIGAPKIPNVGWDDVGGLTNVKDAVMETIQLPLERPELFAKGMKKRSGILFYGPPGTGKTLLAKAIATEFSLNFFSVKGPELLNMYIGESEANVRRVFQRARDARPCVVFFDELDSVAPKRGNQGDSGGVMDRIVSQLLAELDGMSDGEDGGGGVFVIGATNRPDLLDAALLRPGRFDKMLYLGVSDTHDKQATIMEALTRKWVHRAFTKFVSTANTYRFTMAPGLDLKRIASQLPFTYTGADFYALCSDAMLKAVTRQASAVDAKIAHFNIKLQHGELPMTTAYFFDHHATQSDINVLVTEEDFLNANKELIPSVSAKELEHYKRVREQFEEVDEKSSDQATAVAVGSDSKGKAVDGPTQNGVPEWQLPSRPRLNGRPRSRPTSSKGKGKGKAVLSDVDDEEEYDTYTKTPALSNGTGGNGFQDSRVEDDEDLY